MYKVFPIRFFGLPFKRDFQCHGCYQLVVGERLHQSVERGLVGLHHPDLQRKNLHPVYKGRFRAFLVLPPAYSWLQRRRRHSPAGLPL